MRLVRQINHETCQQACIAMLADVEIDDVITLVGDKALGTADRWRAFAHFGIAYPDGESGFVVSVVETPLVRLLRDHKYLLCSVADWKDPLYGHAVVIYDQHIYDPWRGIDPEWPWTRHIWKAVPVKELKEKETMVNITVNGDVRQHIGETISYADVVKHAGYEPTRVLTVVYQGERRGDSQRSGSMHLGCAPVKVEEGMRFNVADTSNA